MQDCHCLRDAARALFPPAFLFSRPSRMTGRIYRWAYTQELFVTSQDTYG